VPVFSLTKWYLDCIDARGNAGIAYWARLRWHDLAMTWSSTIVMADGCTRLRSRVGRVVAPAIEGDELRWRTRDVEIAMTRRAPRFEAALLGNELTWRCEMPRAEVVAKFGDVELRGQGYAEVLQMSALPWTLPIDELRWGRFTSASSSMVWIDWRGPNPLTLVLRDGQVASGARVHDRSIEIDDRMHLTLDQTRVVRDEALGARLSKLPLLGKRLPKRITGAREQKWCSRGTLDASELGWAIHELVSFA
jgi:hypothetical protein